MAGRCRRSARSNAAGDYAAQDQAAARGHGIRLISWSRTTHTLGLTDHHEHGNHSFPAFTLNRHVARRRNIFQRHCCSRAFAVLRSYHLLNANEIAGAVVNRSLAPINVSGFVISLFLLVTGFPRGWKNTPRTLAGETISLMLMAVATGLGQWVIAAKLRALRVGLAVPIDQLPAGDPRRISFNSLHGYSVKALGIAMIAALVAFVMIAYRAARRS